MELASNAGVEAGSVAGPVGSDAVSAEISQRLERMPLTKWHTRILSFIGAIHLTDAFDALTIAYVLPVLMVNWHLSPANAGLLASTGYIGQTIGALFFSVVAERYGRVTSLRCLLFVIAIFAFACAQAESIWAFAVFRFVQGLGLGGESPVSATYMNELCPARMRGRISFVLQSTFGLGNLVAAFAALWLIPRYGWQVMFYLGTMPIILAVLLPKVAPESPRWLVINGWEKEARDIVAHIESYAPAIQNVPLKPSAVVRTNQREAFSALLSHRYIGRSIVVWIMACCSGLATYGILVWLPALYRTVYHLPLDASLRYGLLAMVATLVGCIAGIFIIDKLGRKLTFSLAFAGCAIPMVYLAFSGTAASVEKVAVLASISIAFIAIVQCGIYVYAPELYPTRLRARGAGSATAVTRLASVFSPSIIGALLTYYSIQAAFIYLAIAAVTGMTVIALFGPETRGKELDQISI